VAPYSVVRPIVIQQWGMKLIDDVVVTRWGNVSCHHFYFVYMASMINDKMTYMSNYHYNG